jgi:hypothetical protein
MEDDDAFMLLQADVQAQAADKGLSELVGEAKT